MRLMTVEIKEVASSFNSENEVELVEMIYRFVLDNMTYSGYNPSSVGGAEALVKCSGDCTEYSDLFVTLCRAKGIPARVVEGYIAGADPSELSLGHNWSEVYLEGLGWVPFDTIYDDNNGDSGSTTFQDLQNIYIYTSFIRNDDLLYNYHYYAYSYYGDNVKINKIVTVKNQ